MPAGSFEDTNQQEKEVVCTEKKNGVTSYKHRHRLGRRDEDAE